MTTIIRSRVLFSYVSKTCVYTHACTLSYYYCYYFQFPKRHNAIHTRFSGFLFVFHYTTVTIAPGTTKHSVSHCRHRRHWCVSPGRPNAEYFRFTNRKIVYEIINTTLALRKCINTQWHAYWSPMRFVTITYRENCISKIFTSVCVCMYHTCMCVCMLCTLVENVFVIFYSLRLRY